MPGPAIRPNCGADEAAEGAASAGRFLPAVLLVVLLAVLVYLPGLGDEGAPTQKDEFNLSIRTQIEMLQRGRFLTPFLNGEPRFEKPPLVYWAMYLVGSIFGTSLFLARIPGVLSSVALALGVLALARDMRLDRRKEVLAAFLALTCAGMYALGRMALLDVPLAMFVTWGLFGFCRWTRTGRGAWLVFAALAAGLANMTKGPLGPFLVCAAAVARLTIHRQWGMLREQKKAVAAAALVFIMTALAWPIAMAAEWGEVFTETIREELFGKRFEGLGEGPFTVLGGFLGLMLPWTFLMVAALVTLARHRDDDRRDDLWLIVWILIGTVPFLLLKSKFERYMVPVIPPAALLTVRRLDLHSKEGRVAVWATSVFIVLAAVLPMVPGIWFRIGPWPLWVLALATAAGSSLLFVRRNLLAGVVLYGVFLALMMGSLYPYLGVNRGPDDFARRVDNVRPLYKYNSSRPAFISLHLRRSIVSLRASEDNPEQLERAIGEGAAIVVTGEKLAHFRKMMGQLSVEDLQVIYQWRAFATRKTFLQFTRRDATAEDWRQAWRSRSLDGLRETYLVMRPALPTSTNAGR